MTHTRSGRIVTALAASFLVILVGASSALLGLCGPFTDVAADLFCPFVLEIYYLGITAGTTATTYDPTSNVTRLQMAAFLSRTVDGALKRGGRRAALNQYWALQTTTFFDVTTVGNFPNVPASDGLDVWVPNSGDGSVSRVRTSDGRLLETWTGAGGAVAALSALGSVFVTGAMSPGPLYRIDPRQTAGAVTTVASNLGDFPLQLAFDGQRFWTANGLFAGSGSVSIVTPAVSVPWTVTTVTAGFSLPQGALFDGSSVWVTDSAAGTLLRLDASGSVLQTVTVGTSPFPGPFLPILDGSNIWVPNADEDSVSVVRAGTGVVLATLTGNGLSGPFQAAFDGQRVLVANQFGGSVSLWKAADLTAIGSTPTVELPFGACGDDINFWITLGNNHLARF